MHGVASCQRQAVETIARLICGGGKVAGGAILLVLP